MYKVTIHKYTGGMHRSFESERYAIAPEGFRTHRLCETLLVKAVVEAM